MNVHSPAVGKGTAHVSYARAISTWLHRRLGTARAFVMAGAGLGTMILPIFAQTLLGRFGWRATYVLLGGGLQTAGAVVHERGQPRCDSAPTADRRMTWQDGVPTYSFWITVGTLFVGSVSMSGAITHMAAFIDGSRRDG